MAEFDLSKPEYPDLLLPKTWDKKKSILSAKVETGVGELLKETHELYGKVDWSLLNFFYLMPTQSFDAVVWQGHYDTALVEAANKIMPVSRKLDEVAKQAKEAKALFKDNKLSPKSDVKLAEDVEDAAKSLAGELHLNRVKPWLLSEYEAHLAQVAKTVDILRKSGKPTLNLFVQAIKRIQIDGSPEVFAKQQMEARKLTQIVGNIVRFAKKGFDFGVDEKECKKLFDALDDWANGRIEWTAETTEKEKKAEILKMVKAAKDADALFK
jgi:hypothetical protein